MSEKGKLYTFIRDYKNNKKINDEWNRIWIEDTITIFVVLINKYIDCALINSLNDHVEVIYHNPTNIVGFYGNKSRNDKQNS